MKPLKPITEISDEDLLKLIQDNPIEVHHYDYSNDVLEFLSVYGIQQGEHQILVPLIYNIYKKWSKNPLHRSPFGAELTKLFPSKKYGKGTVYLINKDKHFFLERGLNKKQNKTKRKSWLKHFKRFIDKFDLKSGRFYVKDVVLYNIYDKWVYKNNSRNPLSLFQFLKFCRLFFKNPRSKVIKGHEYFSLNENIKEYLTPDLINLMKQK